MTRALLTEEDVKAKLRAQLDGSDQAKVAIADRLGIAPSRVSLMLRTPRSIGHGVAARLGYRRVTRFEPIE